MQTGGPWGTVSTKPTLQRDGNNAHMSTGDSDQEISVPLDDATGSAGEFEFAYSSRRLFLTLA